MKQLIVCPEYPPAEYAGGIGTYVHHISRMLVEAGDTVHVVATRWKGARLKEERIHDRLIIHRVGALRTPWRELLAPDRQAKELSSLRASSFPPQAFSFQAGLLVEKLIEQEQIDLIEGQEFEAPLYYLMLRRALGLGPKRRPPCIVHLHSPMEFIVRHNDWDIRHPYFRIAKCLEDYCIQAADARLCPSRYLARQALAHYGLPDDAIQVISLPISAGSHIKRSPDIWKNGTILYVGRLERRKGVLEWIQAAVRAARRDPRLNFEFVGANCLSTDHLTGEEIIDRLVPTDLKKQFHFRSRQKQTDLPRFFAAARLAVVPSRWENFPNTCLEAMCTGLPIISTREGGMVEMIDDGHTGWLAKSADANGLSETLERALHTPASDLAQMGAAAAASIRKKCDNNRVLEEHLKFRNRVFQKGVIRSGILPRNPPNGTGVSHRKNTIGNLRRNMASNGIAVVITCCNSGHYLDECLESIRRQSRQPVAAVIVDDNSTESETKQILKSKEKNGWEILRRTWENHIPCKNQGILHIIESGINPSGFSFLDAEDQLSPGFIETCTSILKQCPEVGLISGWVEFRGKRNPIRINPCAGFPYQWVANEIAPFAAVRTEALMAAGQFRSGMAGEYESWDLFNAVLAADWRAVTVPDILGCCRFKKEIYDGGNLNIQRGMRKAMLTRFPELITQDAADIIMMTETQTGLLLQQQYLILKSRVSRAFERIIGNHFRLRGKTRRGNG